MIRLLTAGESHGPGISVIIDGFPSGLKIDPDFIKRELKRRRTGMGRSLRMEIEGDRVETIAGVKNGMTTGSPIALFIENVDYRNGEFLNRQNRTTRITIPRPGHADLPGLLKFGLSDIQDVSERASARETVSRVAAGAIFKLFLKEFGINIDSKVISIGPARKRIQMTLIIKKARELGDTIGGIVEVYGYDVCPGLGSYTQFDKRLDAMIGMAMFSIPSVKCVEIGEGIKSASRFGSEIHDKIFFNRNRGFYRKTNNAGGIEGGMSNGERIIIRLYVKPIPTLQRPISSIDITTKKRSFAPTPRSDVCVVESIGVIGESMLAYVLTLALCEKFGGDCLVDIKKSYQAYLRRIRNV